MATRERAKRGFWLSGNGLLLAAALLSSAVAWWMIAWPVATLSNLAAHEGHFALTFAHMIGGTGMLFLGGLNLYLAARKDRFALHRRAICWSMSGTPELRLAREATSRAR